MEKHEQQAQWQTASQKKKRFSLPIGVRLFLAFQVMILLVGIIGFVALQQLNTLTSKANELNTHDLPEVIVLGHIRTQLFQAKDAEWNIVYYQASNNASQPMVKPIAPPASSAPASPDSGDGLAPSRLPPLPLSAKEAPSSVTPLFTTVSLSFQSKDNNAPTLPQLISNLDVILRDLAKQRVALNSFEPSGAVTSLKDSKTVRIIVDGISQAVQIFAQIKQLVAQGNWTQARQLYTKQQEPLLTTMLDASAKLRTLEQQETTADAQTVQRDSSEASLLILAITAVALLLSILLALLITRSLTRPLSQLLVATGTIASGNLDYETKIMRNDEVGRLAVAFDHMRLSLRSTIAMLALERRQTQAIIEASTDGVLLVDAKRRVLQCNPSVVRLSGLSVTGAVGKRWCELFTPAASLDEDDKTHLKHCVLCQSCHLPHDGAADNEPLELCIQRPGGQLRWLTFTCSPLIVDHQEQGRLVIDVHDITQHKLIEQMKTDFVAMVSHELRAPLTTVTGSVEMLNTLDPQEDDESYREVLSILNHQTRRLRQVVEEVLQLTRFEAGRLPVDLQPLPVVQSICEFVDAMHREWVNEERELTLETAIEETSVWADRSMLEIIFRNLLDNARKYTPAHTPVTITLLPSSQSEEVLIRVDDYGPGIPEEHLESIFERFSRGTQTSANWNRGYGLGLYIARELLRAHNGRIWVENRPEGGARFNICLHVVDALSIVHMTDPQMETIQRQEILENERDYSTYRR